MALKRYALLVISFLVLALIIIYSDPEMLVFQLSKADLTFVIISFVVSTIEMAFRVLKWKVLLSNVSFAELFPIQVLGMTISNFTPGKIAEPVKAFLLKMKKGTPVSETIPSIIWERILDVVLIIVLSLFAIQLISSVSHLLIISFISMAAFIALIVLLIIVLYNKKIGMKIFRIVRRFPVFNRITINFVNTFYKSRFKKSQLIKSLAFTVVSWILVGLTAYFSFLSIGIETSPILMIGIVSLSVLIGILSMLPGGIGSTEVVMIILLGFIGIEGVAAVTGVFLYRFISFWYSIILGGASFLYLGRKLNLKNII